MIDVNCIADVLVVFICTRSLLLDGSNRKRLILENKTVANVGSKKMT